MKMKWKLELARAAFDDSLIQKAKDRRSRIINFIAQSDKLDLTAVNWEIEDFVTLDDTLKEQIKLVYGDIGAYIRRGGDRRPINVLLFASPGAGKSHLVKCLSKQAGRDFNVETDFHLVDMSGILSAKDLINQYDQIRDTRLQNKIPFILFDEVDKEVNREFSLFSEASSLMAEGIYGQTHRIGSSVFFFAGTFQAQLARLGLQIEQKEGTYTNPAIDKYRKDLGEILPRLLRSTMQLDSVIPSLAAQAMPTSKAIVDAMQESPKPLDREQWEKNTWQALQAVAYSGINTGLIDFLDRIDRLILIPSLGLYFEDRDNKKDPYFLEEEALYHFVWVIKQRWSKITKVEKRALATLCWHFLRSRRVRDRCLFLSKAELDSEVYKIEHVPIELIVDEEIENQVNELRVTLEGTLPIS